MLCQIDPLVNAIESFLSIIACEFQGIFNFSAMAPDLHNRVSTNL